MDLHADMDRFEPQILAAQDQWARMAPAAMPYVFRTVKKRNLLQIKISGFWTTDTIADFARDLATAIASLDCAENQHLICCDVSDAAIQPQEVVGAFQQLIAYGPSKARKIALFTASLLSRMQSRRIVSVRDNIACFETQAAALSWLLADEGSTA